MPLPTKDHKKFTRIKDEDYSQSRMFIVSRPFCLDGISYLPGDKLMDQLSIDQILQSGFLSKKGQIHFINVR